VVASTLPGQRGNAAKILETADSAIVGTHLKIGGSTWNVVDPQRARTLVEIVRAARARS